MPGPEQESRVSVSKRPEVKSAAAAKRINGECLHGSDICLKKLSSIQIRCISPVLPVDTESMGSLHIQAQL